MAREPLHNILEALLGIGKIKSKEDLNSLLDELEKMPDFEIDFEKGEIRKLG